MRVSLRSVSDYEFAPLRRSTRTVRHAAMLSLALLAGACGGAPTPAHPEAAQAEAEESTEREANREVVQAKLAEARAALEEGAPRKARMAAQEARRAAGQGDWRDVRAVMSEIDAHEAKEIAVEVRQLAAGRQCQEATDTVVAIMNRTPPPGRTLVSTLHEETEAALVACLKVDLDEAIVNQDFARARSLLKVPAIKTSLRDEAWKAVVATLHEGIANSIADELRADVEAGRYDDATRKLAAAQKLGDLGPEHAEGVVEQFQKMFTIPLLVKIEGLLDGGKGDAQATLDELDAIARLLKWELSDELATARRALSVLAECREQRCTFPKPERRWTYGNTPLAPPHASQAQPTKAIESAQQVYILARSPSRSLIVTEEPASDISLKQRLLAVAGWADNSQLKNEDTIDWLLPGNELVGARVFGPFREGDKNYHLGIVTSVEGAQVTVKRLSDEALVTAPRASLRSGRLAPGIKVFAYCANPLKMETAVIDREVPQESGMPLVRIACPGATPPRNEVPGAIVSKAEWLPRRKP